MSHWWEDSESSPVPIPTIWRALVTCVLEKAMVSHSSTLAWKIPWMEEPGRLRSMGSDTSEQLHFHFSLSRIREGNGNPLQCSCLENPRDGGAWWAAVYGVAQSRTRLKWLSSSSNDMWLKPQMDQFKWACVPSGGNYLVSLETWFLWGESRYLDHSDLEWLKALLQFWFWDSLPFPCLSFWKLALPDGTFILLSCPLLLKCSS